MLIVIHVADTRDSFIDAAKEHPRPMVTCALNQRVRPDGPLPCDGAEREYMPDRNGRHTAQGIEKLKPATAGDDDDTVSRLRKLLPAPSDSAPKQGRRCECKLSQIAHARQPERNRMLNRAVRCICRIERKRLAYLAGFWQVDRVEQCVLFRTERGPMRIALTGQNDDAQACQLNVLQAICHAALRCQRTQIAHNRACGFAACASETSAVHTQAARRTAAATQQPMSAGN